MLSEHLKKESGGLVELIFIGLLISIQKAFSEKFQNKKFLLTSLFSIK